MRIIAVVLVLIFPSIVSAQAFGNVGSRAEGMAGAFVAVADDATAVYWNPAGLATGATVDAQVFVGRESNRFVGLGLPMFGVSYYRLHTVSGSADRHNEGSGRVPIRTVTTNNVGITVLQTIANGMVIGSTLRVVKGGMEGFQARRTLDLDAGAMLSLGNVRLGVTARNLRQPEFQGDLGAFLMKRQVRAGVALVPRALPSGVHGPFSLAFDMDLTETTGPFGETRGAAVGAEYWLAQGRLGTRAGVRWSTLEERKQAVSGGLSVKLPRSFIVDGHVTKTRDFHELKWGVSGRVTF
jgi:hypothetical protein